MTGSDPDADDVVQDAYVKAIKNLGRFDHRCAFRSWLLRIVTNCATDQLRKNRRRLSIFDLSSWTRGDSRTPVEPSCAVDPAAPLESAELRGRIDNALAQLSETTRGAFVLYAEAEMTYQEVAETLNIPLGTVMSRIHGARKKLRVFIGDQDSDDEKSSAQSLPTRTLSEVPRTSREIVGPPADQRRPLSHGFSG